MLHRKDEDKRSASLNAARSGSILRADDQSELLKLVEQAKAKATQAVSLRIPVADLERAKSIAAKQGVGYQAVLRQAIRTGLHKAG